MHRTKGPLSHLVDENSMVDTSTETEKQREEALIEEGLLEWDDFARSRRRAASRLRVYGKVLLGACWVVLAALGLIVSLFFPGMKGKGLPPGSLWFFIPVWSIGVIGILLMVLGWLLWPDRDAWLQPGVLVEGMFGSETTLGVPTWKRWKQRLYKGVCTFTLILVLLGCVSGLLIEPTPPDTWRQAYALAYFGSCYALFLLYGLWFYRNGESRLVTTYLNATVFIIGLALIPATWLLMLLVALYLWMKRLASPHRGAV
jgi:hypothetical protein